MSLLKDIDNLTHDNASYIPSVDIDINTNDNTSTSASTKQSRVHTTETSVSKDGYPMITIYSVRKIHSISFEIDVQRSIALLNKLDIQYKAPVELSVMLRYACELLQQSMVKHIIQPVTYSDWNAILKPSGVFKEHSKGDGIINVICPVEKFSEAVMIGLGFEKIDMN
jgi:hypothetical protein